FHESNLMCPSNLSTVVAPSLVWQPSTSADHTAAIIDAQHANKTIQCFITHAFYSNVSSNKFTMTREYRGGGAQPQRASIFGVDRAKDWDDFFSKYGVEEPPK
ncbi:hypothetical protein ANCDUO_20486, partial [Ancylostoma duodenale]